MKQITHSDNKLIIAWQKLKIKANEIKLEWKNIMNSQNKMPITFKRKQHNLFKNRKKKL